MGQPGGAASQPSTQPYGRYVQQCLDTLIESGTDRYGTLHTPMLVSILDIESRSCPQNPEKFDETYRVYRRERRNPAGSNLFTDQATLRAAHLLSARTGAARYAEFANRYSAYVMGRLLDDKGMFWWGGHRHYDVYRDVKDGHMANHHELYAGIDVDWPHLWAVDAKAVTREIEAIWQWHVIDKKTGETNRHADGGRGCDFSMTAASHVAAFAFMFAQTKDRTWLERARLLADYFWTRRNKTSNLIPERPNAGADRFDGGSFVTAVTGPHCHALLQAFELTGETAFRDYALAYLKAYGKYAYDAKTGRYFGALRLDGSPIPGPRITDTVLHTEAGYGGFEPRGHLDLWQPYLLGYEHGLATAQVYAHAYHITGDADMLTNAQRFAEWIRSTPPGQGAPEASWFRPYSTGPGQKGAYAEHYARAVSFFLHLFVATGKQEHLRDARSFADAAIAGLWHKGLFRGHPAKPYYEAIDGVGGLLCALLALDEVIRDPAAAAKARSVRLGPDGPALPLTDW